VSVGGDTTHLTELYELMELKYMYAKTRYVLEDAFIRGIKRELMIVWPIYIKQKELITSMMDLEIEEIRKVSSNLSNTVNTNDSPVVDADKIAISDLSTSQTSNLSKQGMLAALMSKYEAIRMDYVRMVYAKCDDLFQKILSRNMYVVYDQEENALPVEVL